MKLLKRICILCLSLFLFTVISCVSIGDKGFKEQLVLVEYNDSERVLEFTKSILWSALYDVELSNRKIFIFSVYNTKDGKINYETIFIIKFNMTNINQ